MAIRQVTIAPGEYYHLYSRGVDKRPICIDREDYRRFMRLVHICNSTHPVKYRKCKKKSLTEIDIGKRLVAIGCYCFMPNHFHILVKETEEGGTVTFMRKLLTSYSQYFNKKYERTGVLFGSRYKSQYLDSDRYLKYIFAYIHLNPLKLILPNWKKSSVDENSAQIYLQKYFFSSYCDYIGNVREENIILNKEAFPEYHISIKEWSDSMKEWIMESEIT